MIIRSCSIDVLIQKPKVVTYGMIAFEAVRAHILNYLIHCWLHSFIPMWFVLMCVVQTKLHFVVYSN